MKKIGSIFIIGLLLIGFAFAGGIVTNTNQSADFIRLLNRNASTDIDAVYFNPAGITLLNKGLSFYLSSQTIFQDRIVKSNVASLAQGTVNGNALDDGTFDGETFAPVFPNFYVAYKTGNLAIGAGFVPIGGGGSAVFENGLPSFVVPASLLPAGLTGQGIPTTAYSLDVDFDGSSTYLGGQAVVSYKINDMISVAGGGRYFTAKNTYKGHLKDIMINPNYPALGADGSMVKAVSFFNNASAAAALGAQGAQGVATQLQPLIDGGAGSFTFAQLVGAGMLDQATVDALAAGFAQLGLPFDPTTVTAAVAHATAQTAAATLTAQSQGLKAQAAQVADIEVDAEQTGSGFAPIFGLYVSPLEGLDIGIRYEGKASMTLTNETKVDGSGLFPDEAETGADMPALFAAGISYLAMPSLRLEADITYYFNEDVDWSGREKYVENSAEFGVGAEFLVSDRMLFSAGYLNSKGGAINGYHTDLSHTFDTYTVGVGGRYYINPNLYISLGASSTVYDDLPNDGVSYRGLITGNEEYDKSTLNFAIGVGFSR